LPPRLALLLIAAFAFRLAFGLCSEFWSEDETQIFLLGLRYHATGEWPYFGPDVVWTRSQLPGALQALLVGLPLRVASVPEAPFVLLNILSLAALAFLGWYVRRRLPSLPSWLVYGWLFTAPWTLNFSTHVVNPSYVLPAAILFFIGLLEALPALRVGAIDPRVAFFLMGFALLWVVQLHMSWVVMAAFILFVLWKRRREGVGSMVGAAAWIAAGAVLPGCLLVPTLWTHGLLAGGGESNIEAQWVGPWTLVTIAARFLSFASFEVVRFVGLSTARRLFFLGEHPWLAPLVAVLVVAGIAQPLAMLMLWLRKSTDPQWAAVKRFVLATVLLVYASYFLSAKEPLAHAFYLVAPLAFIYAFHCFALVDSPRVRRVAAALLVIGVVFHAALALARIPERSLYKDRPVAAAAVRLKVPEMLGQRRPYARDIRPDRRVEPPGNPQADLRVTVRRWWRATGGSSVFRLRIENLGTEAAYRDLRFSTLYRDAAGNAVRTGRGRIYEVLQPGEKRVLRAFSEGHVDARAASGELRLIGAEKLVPIPVSAARR
jgi:hypothetical protein